MPSCSAPYKPSVLCPISISEHTWVILLVTLPAKKKYWCRVVKTKVRNLLQCNCQRLSGLVNSLNWFWRSLSKLICQIKKPFMELSTKRSCENALTNIVLRLMIWELSSLTSENFHLNLDYGKRALRWQQTEWKYKYWFYVDTKNLPLLETTI